MSSEHCSQASPRMLGRQAAASWGAAVVPRRRGGGASAGASAGGRVDCSTAAAPRFGALQQLARPHCFWLHCLMACTECDSLATNNRDLAV